MASQFMQCTVGVGGCGGMKGEETELGKVGRCKVHQAASEEMARNAAHVRLSQYSTICPLVPHLRSQVRRYVDSVQVPRRSICHHSPLICHYGMSQFSRCTPQGLSVPFVLGKILPQCGKTLYQTLDTLQSKCPIYQRLDRGSTVEEGHKLANRLWLSPQTRLNSTLPHQKHLILPS